MRTLYAVLSSKPSEQDITQWIADVTRDRANDLSDYETQEAVHPRIYPEPTSGSDMRGTEKVGDIAVGSHHLYIVVDDGGTLAWKRTALANYP